MDSRALHRRTLKRQRTKSRKHYRRACTHKNLERKPAVFLFDEPLSNLDAKLRVQMRAEIKKLQHRLGTTAVYLTHDQVEAMTMGHRIAVLKDGRLQQCGSPIEVYDRPANLFVANFIGTSPMNFIQGKISAEGSRLEATKISLPAAGPLRAVAAGKGGKKVVIGVRPENILDPTKEARGEQARLTLEVEIIEPLGHEVIIHGRVGDDLLVCKFDPHHAPAMGSKVEVVIELDKLHLFDAETERRLTA